MQGWQSIDRLGKPGWETPSFPGLGNTPRICITGQYWVIRYFFHVFIIKTICIFVLFLKIRVLFVHKYILNSCSEGGKDI